MGMVPGLDGVRAQWWFQSYGAAQQGTSAPSTEDNFILEPRLKEEHEEDSLSEKQAEGNFFQDPCMFSYKQVYQYA
jgi:hypothetical protein